MIFPVGPEVANAAQAQQCSYKTSFFQTSLAVGRSKSDRSPRLVSVADGAGRCVCELTWQLLADLSMVGHNQGVGEMMAFRMAGFLLCGKQSI